MSLQLSKFLGKRLTAIFGTVFICLFAIYGIVSSHAAASFWSPESMPPTPAPLPSPTAAPVAAQSPAPSPSGTPGPTPAATVSPGATPTGTPGSGIRDLSLYENAGTITVSTSPSQQDAALAQARTFLLRKWNTRSLGRMSLIHPTPTGLQATQNFFVERDASGSWKITIEMADSDPVDFYVVEDIGVTADGRPIIAPTTGAPASHALHLKPSNSARNGIVL